MAQRAYAEPQHHPNRSEQTHRFSVESGKLLELQSKRRLELAIEQLQVLLGWSGARRVSRGTHIDPHLAER
jgi:hypothetical protein